MTTSAVVDAESRDVRAGLQRIGWATLVLLTAVYIAFFAQLTSYPYQDFPNHLTRAVVLADLIFDQGARFRGMFEYGFMPIPYVLGDLLFAALVALTGPTIAAALWTTLVLASLPAALLFYTHVNGPIRNGRVFVLLLSLCLATDWFFLLGFTQYRLGLALMLVAMGFADLLRVHWSGKVFSALCATVIIAYFSHLASIVFIAPAVAVSGTVRWLYRRTTLKRELAIAAPILAMLLWHFGFAEQAYRGDALPAYTHTWGTMEWRIQALQFELLRFGGPSGKLLMVMLTVVVCWGLWWDLRWRQLLRPRAVEMSALTLTFLAIYFVLPKSYADAEYVAVRALAPITLFIILGRAFLAEESPARPAFADGVSLSLAALLATLNLVYLAMHLTRQDAFAAGYRDIIARIPSGATVLPVYTGGRRAMVNTRLHLGSLAVMDRDALTPYLFSGDAGHPMKYFRYARRPYAPPENWYVTDKPVTVDWRSIACSYRFLLVGKPYDPGRIPLRTSVTAENESAALLAIARQPNECKVAEREGFEPD